MIKIRTLLTITIMLQIISMAGYCDENTWTTNGPYSCRVMTIAIHPQENRIIFIGTVENGIYKTTNQGETWQHLESSLLPRTLRHIIIHPTDPNIIYAATLEGLYKSNDSGNNWSSVALPPSEPYEIIGFTIHPTRPNLMFVTGTPLSGINYRSTDGGQTWEALNMELASLVEFEVDPLNQNIIYSLGQSARFRKSMYKSQDYAETWENIHNDLDTTTSGFGFAIDPVETNTLYFGGHDFYHASGKCMYKSIDGGNHWFDITPEGLLEPYVRDIVVSRFDHNVVFACTESNGALKSIDGGETWTEINNGLSVRSMYSLEFDTATGYLYLGTLWDGLYRTMDNGDSWQKISYKIPNTYCIDFAVNISNAAEQLVAYFGGLYYTSDYGSNWEHMDILAPTHQSFPACVSIDNNDPDILIAGLNRQYWSNESNRIIRSTDGGISWETVYDGFPFTTYFKDIKQAVFTRNYYLASTEGLYYSNDSGLNWQLLNDGIYADRFYSIAISPINPDYVYVGGFSLYRTTDGGSSWEQLPIPPGGDYVSEVICDPIDEEKVYVINYFGDIFVAADGGYTWVNIRNNLPYYPDYKRFSGLAVNPLNPDNLYINSHHFGVFQSHDGGNLWEPYNEGLNTLYSGAFTIISPTDTNKIFIATDEQSVWSIHRTPTGIDDNRQPLPLQLALSAYPNPFNATANISFSLPEAGNVRLDIYDLLGRQTASLLDSFLPAGNHSLLWHPEDLAAGIYIYRLTTHTGLATDYYQISKKITLLK